MIGTKTITSLALVALAAALAWHGGFLRPERLLALDGRTAFAVGCFGIVVGTLVFRFWRLYERSAHYLRFSRERAAAPGEAHFVGSQRRRVVVGDNRGEAVDLSPRKQYLMVVALVVLVALSTLGPRALSRLASLPDRLQLGRSEFCPESIAPEAPEVDANEPGCALIRRAYELGYAKDLGSCARKEQAATKTVCDRRQHDEPYLHYAWRRLERFYRSLQGMATPGYFAALRRDFEGRLDGLETLVDSQRQLINSTPRSSQHIFTNLPPPDETLLRTTHCLERTRHLPQRAPTAGGATGPSRVLEHILAQLVFEARYEPSAGSCREYQIHWGAPTDACAELARDPEHFLARMDGAEHVRAALERRRISLERRELDAKTGRHVSGQGAIPEASQIIGLFCYIEEPRPAASWRSIETRVFGERLEAHEVRVPPATGEANSLPIDRYGYVARLLARGFHYGGLLSDAAVDVAGAEDSITRTLAGGDFMLTRLNALAGIDVFVTPEALAGRDDLLEVYPYHLHLRNYVHLFRQQYAREHSRL